MKHTVEIEVGEARDGRNSAMGGVVVPLLIAGVTVAEFMVSREGELRGCGVDMWRDLAIEPRITMALRDEIVAKAMLMQASLLERHIATVELERARFLSLAAQTAAPAEGNP